MQKYKKPDVSKLDGCVNPFSVPLKIEVRKFEDLHKFVRDDDVLVNSTYTLETAQKCSLYVSSEKRLVVNFMKPSSKELFLWIMYTVETNKDYVWINKDRYMKELNIGSINTYKNAIEDLVRYGFIAKSLIKDTYWINPEFFFNGNRALKYPKNIVTMNKFLD